MTNVSLVVTVSALLLLQPAVYGQKSRPQTISVQVTVLESFDHDGDLFTDGQMTRFRSETGFAGTVGPALTTSSGQVCIDTSVWADPVEPGEIEPAGLLPSVACGVGTVGVTAFSDLPQDVDTRRQASITWKEAVSGREYRLQFGDAYSAPTPNYAHVKCLLNSGGGCNTASVDTRAGTFPTGGSEPGRVTGPDARLSLLSGRGVKGARVLGVYRVPFAFSVNPR